MIDPKDMFDFSQLDINNMAKRIYYNAAFTQRDIESNCLPNLEEFFKQKVRMFFGFDRDRQKGYFFVAKMPS